MKRLCVFCGSSTGGRPEYRQAAEELGRVVARAGVELVYGGGRLGLMGVLADAALAEGGRVIGIIPRFLSGREIAHAGITELRVVESMHERKALMADLADGFLTLAGGLGTLDEFCEILSWAQLGLHNEPCGMINTAGFFDAFLRQLDHSVAEGFMRPEHRDMILIGDDPSQVLVRMKLHRHSRTSKWPALDVR